MVAAGAFEAVLDIRPTGAQAVVVGVGHPLSMWECQLLASVLGLDANKKGQAFDAEP